MKIGHNSGLPAPLDVDGDGKAVLAIESLPASVQDIAANLGMPVVMALVENFGGLELRIPHKLKSDHMLMALGVVHAEAICAYCPGDTIHLPKTLNRSRLREQVLRLEAAGWKRREIARELGIHQRSVRRLANAPVNDPNQMDMFR